MTDGNASVTHRVDTEGSDVSPRRVYKYTSPSEDGTEILTERRDVTSWERQ